MKKVFFLCAAAALFAACSSDDAGVIENVDPGVTPPAEAIYAASGSVEFTNGVTMLVGALDENEEAITRSVEGESVEFCIDLTKLENDVLRGFDDYKLKADDFAIRVDGEYMENIVANNNKVETLNIQLIEQGLKVAVKDLQKLNFNKADNYTFEVYLWIENKKLLDDGTGAYGELFTDADKKDWIYSQSWPVAEGEETGVDLSEKIWIANGSDGSAFFTEDSPAAGLLVKYNVYRGLQGRNGDTPYIKVSIHVEKPEQTTVGAGENQATWIHIPYVAK